MSSVEVTDTVALLEAPMAALVTVVRADTVVEVAVPLRHRPPGADVKLMGLAQALTGGGAGAMLTGVGKDTGAGLLETDTETAVNLPTCRLGVGSTDMDGTSVTPVSSPATASQASLHSTAHT